MKRFTMASPKGTWSVNFPPFDSFELSITLVAVNLVRSDSISNPFTKHEPCSQSSPLQSDRLPELQQNLAGFLLVRGAYAWLGWGFLGCAAEYNYTQPEELSLDYGTPIGRCAAGSTAGVFTREFTKATVELDCKEWVGTIKMKH